MLWFHIVLCAVHNIRCVSIYLWTEYVRGIWTNNFQIAYTLCIDLITFTLHYLGDVYDTWYSTVYRAFIIIQSLWEVITQQHRHVRAFFRHWNWWKSLWTICINFRECFWWQIYFRSGNLLSIQYVKSLSQVLVWGAEALNSTNHEIEIQCSQFLTMKTSL